MVQIAKAQIMGTGLEASLQNWLIIINESLGHYLELLII